MRLRESDTWSSIDPGRREYPQTPASEGTPDDPDRLTTRYRTPSSAFVIQSPTLTGICFTPHCFNLSVLPRLRENGGIGLTGPLGRCCVASSASDCLDPVDGALGGFGGA